MTVNTQSQNSVASRPILNPPCRGWTRDLIAPANNTSAPGTHETPVVNSINDTYLEISRRHNNMRGLLLLIVPIFVATLIFTAPMFTIGELDIVFLFLAIPTYTGLLWLTALFIRVDISIPRDEPIRFNRLRRKVYVYSFHFSKWNPFARWYVTTHTYNWEDLRAELWRQRGATPQGGLLITWGVSIAVVKPGTNDVIDRFPLSVGQDEGSSWDYVRAYMQVGPEALPPVEAFNDPNEVSPLNLALRFAPKVEWPAAIDLESRSGR